MKNGNWSRASIERDRARWDAKHPEPYGGDPFPVGLSPEELTRLGYLSEPIACTDPDY